MGYQALPSLRLLQLQQQQQHKQHQDQQQQQQEMPRATERRRRQRLRTLQQQQQQQQIPAERQGLLGQRLTRLLQRPSTTVAAATVPRSGGLSCVSLPACCTSLFLRSDALRCLFSQLYLLGFALYLVSPFAAVAGDPTASKVRRPADASAGPPRRLRGPGGSGGRQCGPLGHSSPLQGSTSFVAVQTPTGMVCLLRLAVEDRSNSAGSVPSLLKRREA